MANMPKMPEHPEEKRKEREAIIVPIMKKMQELLQELQEAGNLPMELVQKVSMSRINDQFGIMGEMMNEAKELEAKNKEDKKA